jgi:hypothetical protein
MYVCMHACIYACNQSGSDNTHGVELWTCWLEFSVLLCYIILYYITLSVLCYIILYLDIIQYCIILDNSTEKKGAIYT